MKKKPKRSTKQRLQQNSGAASSRDIPLKMREALVAEAGGKCANPGCSAWRTHIHHIARWSVRKAHNAKHMIAICPSCHDAAHLKQLSISDDTIYDWKGIKRPGTQRAHLYVEPGTTVRLHLGTVGAQARSNSATIFHLSPINTLSFKVVAPSLLSLLVSTGISTIDGRCVLRVVDNHIEVLDTALIEVKHHAGRFSASTTSLDHFVPNWFVSQMREQQPAFASDGRLNLVDLEVVAPGIVRVKGTWANTERVICITDNSISFCTPSLREPISFVGAGPDATVFSYTGPITTALFGFTERGVPVIADPISNSFEKNC